MRFKQQFGGQFKQIGLIIILIVIGMAGFSAFYTVQPDEEAVLIRFGKYVRTNEPGLHFKLPLGIDRIIKIKTKRVHQAEFGFRTRSVTGSRTNYSSGGYTQESLMLTGDLNVADVEWVVQYQISDPFKFIFQTSSPGQNIRDISESIMRRVVGDRLVTDVLTTGRVEIALEARKLMQEVLDKYDMGVRVITVKLQDVNPPERVKPSFNEVNEAKQEQEKVINQAEESYNRVIPEARGKAHKLLSEAQGWGQEIINRSKGDAENFTEILKSYRLAPAITRKRIYIETMEQIFSKIKNYTVVDPKVRGVLPIFQGNIKGVSDAK